MTPRKKTALTARNSKGADFLEWARLNRGSLSEHELWAAGTTGWLLEHELGVKVNRVQSGPLGGDRQIGARIAEGATDFLVARS